MSSDDLPELKMLSSPESSGKRHRRILNSLGPRWFHRRARPSWIASPPSLAGDGKRRLGDCLRAPPPPPTSSADDAAPLRRSHHDAMVHGLARLRAPPIEMEPRHSPPHARAARRPPPSPPLTCSPEGESHRRERKETRVRV